MYACMYVCLYEGCIRVTRVASGLHQGCIRVASGLHQGVCMYVCMHACMYVCMRVASGLQGLHQGCIRVSEGCIRVEDNNQG